MKTSPNFEFGSHNANHLELSDAIEIIKYKGINAKCVFCFWKRFFINFVVFDSLWFSLDCVSISSLASRSNQLVQFVTRKHGCSAAAVRQRIEFRLTWRIRRWDWSQRAALRPPIRPSRNPLSLLARVTTRADPRAHNWNTNGIYESCSGEVDRLSYVVVYSCICLSNSAISSRTNFIFFKSRQTTMNRA